METLNFKSGLTMETEWLIHFDALAVRISQHRARCIENAFHDPQVKRLFLLLIQQIPFACREIAEDQGFVFPRIGGGLSDELEDQFEE